MPRLQINGATYSVVTWQVTYAADKAPPSDGSKPPLGTLPGWAMYVVSETHIPGMVVNRLVLFGWAYDGNIFGERAKIVNAYRMGDEYIYEAFGEVHARVLLRRKRELFRGNPQQLA